MARSLVAAGGYGVRKLYTRFVRTKPPGLFDVKPMPAIPPRLFAPIILLGAFLSARPALAQPVAEEPIDRRALVTRHNPVIERTTALNALSVGNGRFAFTADITGLQSYPEAVSADSALPGYIPLNTQSEWGWHTFPNPEGYTLDDALQPYDHYGRPVGYASAQNTPAGQWLRQNPHRLNLGRVGLRVSDAAGRPLGPDELTAARQTLDLWTGTLLSTFQVNGVPVRVETRVHPDQDLLAVRIHAPGVPPARIQVVLAFPYGSPAHTGDAGDWSRADKHGTSILSEREGEVVFARTLDADRYYVRASGPYDASYERTGPHEYLFSFSAPLDPLEFTIGFSPTPFAEPAPDVAAAEKAVRAHWEGFWTSGGAVDFSGSTDPRAHELERRVVLSQYLTAIQGSGSLPPQETGLTFNSWHGKAHLEMHWWHGVHFALWDRLPLLERSLDWYGRILPKARQTAGRQGYRGARWPKMIGPDGRESPSGVGVFLTWQQPHPIYYAELVYRRKADRATLDRFREVVFETADFMASYAHWDAAGSRYVLGPPLIPAQELHPARTTFNPTFELAYWRFGLETARRWRERLGLPRDPQWERVLQNLAPYPTDEGLYTNAESDRDTFTDPAMRRDHPTLLGACGMLPCPGIDRPMMRATLKEVLQSWDWPSTWGWDYPLVAMTAARLGEPDLAVDALMMPVVKNTYLPNGHNYQREGLVVYLPGNGGLLTAVAMMAAGWDGAPEVHAPGFPNDGRWKVRWENLNPMP